MKWGFVPQGDGEAALPGRQRRRVRAGDLQGHPADDGQPAHPGRGLIITLVRDPGQPRLHLRPRRGAARQPPAARAVRRPTPPATSARTSTARASTSSSSSTPAPARTSAARRPRCSTRSRAAAASRGSSPPFPAVAGLYARPTVVNNVETIATVPCIVANGADWFTSMGTEKSPGYKLFSLSGHVTPPGPVRGAAGHHAAPAARVRRRDARRRRAEVLDARRLQRRRCSPPSTSTCRWTYEAWARPARCSARARSRSSTRRPAWSGR